MVITHIIGGLGNQMFQYAAGRSLSLKRGTHLWLDVSDFSNYTLHQGYELTKIFRCTPKIATKEDIRDLIGWRTHPIAKRFLRRKGGVILRGPHYIVEPHFHYWPGIVDVPQDCYLFGYWQSEEYFREASSVIRADFTFRAPLTDQNAELAERIGQVNAVSLHVRRGDYVSNPKSNAAHGVCSLEYYREAIRYILDRVERPHFFIFSDDIRWVEDNLRMDLPCQYIDHNHGAESYNDMHLMYLCRHHIIANSSFSWWGAWLNPNTEKIVIAPKKWFANNNNAEDLFPQRWVAI
jgi:hypothetical protein